MNHPRFDFIGVQISRINFEEALRNITRHHFSSASYICFPDASVVSEANRDPLLKDILNHALFTMPDGKPSELAARLQGFGEVGTVSGFHLCHALLQSPLTHYFYGGDERTLNKMISNIADRYPGANILGAKAPPFIPKEQIEGHPDIAKDINHIRELQPKLLWIGISSPKQDYLMHHFHQQLPQTLMLGVGGVFLYMADESLKSPEWVKKIGMRWAYRLIKEPGRLRKKYFRTLLFLLTNIPSFFRYTLGHSRTLL